MQIFRSSLPWLVPLLVACGAENPDLPVPRRVFFITVDTLRADHLGIYGYSRETSPHVDRLAAGGVLFERAIAQWPKTTPSFASMFTGMYPQTTGMTHRAARELHQGFQTLAEMVQASGYWTGALVSNPVLDKKHGWDRGFDRYWQSWDTDEDPGDDPVKYRTVVNALRVNEMAAVLLQQTAEHERSFVWLHYSDPHTPYVLPPGIENRFLGDIFDTATESVPEDLSRNARIGDETRLGFYIAQYDANIWLVDRAIGEVLEQARELGLLEDALLVFTSDHGEGLGDHDYYFRHGGVPYNSNSRVPLIMVYPGVFPAGRVIERPVELIDLYPTIAELVAGEVPAEMEGASLVPFMSRAGGPLDPTAFAYAFSEAGQPKEPRSYYRSVQDQRWKLVYHPAVQHKSRELPVLFELYDLAEDPAEAHDLVGGHKPEFDRLWQELSGWMLGGESGEAAKDEAEGHDEETLKALRALGYLD